jgi:hypothetical protein
VLFFQKPACAEEYSRMQRSSQRRRLAIVTALAISGLSAAMAQAQSAAANAGGSTAPQTIVPSGPPKVLTGKERLGEKWQDEQRIDNCKVPVEKRGPQPRPDTCASSPSG